MKPARAKTWGFRIAAVALSLAATLLVLEAAARLAGPEYYRFNNNSALYYSNPRGYHVPVATVDGRTVFSIPYVTSRRGYRLPEGARQGAPLVTFGPAVLGLGDSFTFGRGVYYEDIYLTRLARMFEERGVGLAVRNCALSGLNIEGILGVQARESVGRNLPLTIYGFVLNDFGLPGKERIVGLDYIDQNNGGYRYSPMRDTSALANLVGHALDVIRLNRVTRQAYLDAFNPPNVDRGLAALGELSRRVRAEGGVLVVCLWPLLYNLDDYPFQAPHEVLRNFCKRQGIPFLDLLPALAGYRDRDLWVHPTDHHPNEIAHALAAKALFRFLREQGLTAAYQTAS